MPLFEVLLSSNIFLLAGWLLGGKFTSYQSMIQVLLLCLTLDGFNGSEAYLKNITIAIRFVAGHFLIIWTGHVWKILHSQEYWTALTVKTTSKRHQLWKILFDIRWIST